MTTPPMAQPNPDTSTPDVPDVSAEWYLEVTTWAASSPGWAQWLIAFLTEALVVVFLALFLVVWWRARHRPPATYRRALLAPVVTGIAYVSSEAVKVLWQQDRPCRALGEVSTILTCPEVGDWSFPSNHSTIVGAAAVAVLWSSRALGTLAVATALVAATTRVLVGVHYPHDVVAGLLFGAAVATTLPLLSRLPLPVPGNRPEPPPSPPTTNYPPESSVEQTVRLYR
ncbi:phosphatase PAP2 family protein [Saccharothrix lopnurensis]|uniref:Phosphatase PAP2 family protein n=1 Tax=Saccharothrix lopnurensis TaxID=1670621 RepID=A0ABW1P7P8_9PSEU